jgi:hypothetical protein
MDKPDSASRARPARRRWLRWSLLGLSALAAFSAVRVALWRPAQVLGDAPNDGYQRVSGVVHVHTTYSDGGGAPAEVIAAARAVGLEFVAITDHNTFDAKPLEGYRDGVLVLVGCEISAVAGHILSLGTAVPTYSFSRDARDELEDVRDLGGIAFAAHPTSVRPELRWDYWDLPGSWGLELLNGDSEVRETSRFRLLESLALYGLNHRYALLRSLNPPTAALARWDELLARRDAVGITGADAHSRIPIGKRRGLRFPSYESLFSLARNHVLLESPLTGDAQVDTRSILGAFRSGHLYVALDALASADAFSLVAESGGRRWAMGDTVTPAPDLRLRAGGRVPDRAEIRLLRDGRVVQRATRALTHTDVVPGVYRVEVYLPGWSLPWIVTNPIYVFDEPQARERALRAAWPGAAPPPAPQVMLDRFERQTILQSEHDSESTADMTLVGPPAGRGGPAALRMTFRLGRAGPAHPYTWCALVNRERRNWMGRTGLVFGVKADGEYRLWVQVRDANPASIDGGEEWWQASVKATPTRRTVALPFARFRSINPRSDGHLDLDKVRGLVFVIDKGAMPEGSRGTLWLDQLGLY